MDPNRTIRAPSTVTKLVKPSKPTVYNGPLAQTKFRILNSVGLQSQSHQSGSQQLVPSTSLKPSSSSLLRPISAPRLQTTSQRLGQTSIAQPVATTRIPSGLIKPTPVGQIISTATSASSTLLRPVAQQRSPISKTTSNSSANSRIAPQRLPSVKNSTALNSKSSNQTTDNNNASNSTQSDYSFLNSVNGEVGEIRRLLEQLLKILQNSKESHETLEEENARLKKEVAELRAIIQTSVGKQSILLEDRDTFRISEERPTSSGLYYSPMS